MSEVLLGLAAFAAANAVAGFLTGPEMHGPPGAQQTMAARMSYPSVEDRVRAEAAERFLRVGVYVAFNTLAASTLAFLLVARVLERRRRMRLGLPDDLDESYLDPRGPSSGRRPGAATDYRPSVN
jgi:hypothetical protein